MTNPEVVLKHLTPDELSVEPEAQRGYDPKWAKDMADNWDDDKLGVLEVSLRGGKYFVTDGQHRRGALIKMGLGHVPVPCVIFEHDEITEEAKRYLAGNIEKRKPNSIDAFRISVTAKVPEAVAIQAVLDEFSYRFTFSPGQNDLSAVSSVEWVYRRGQSTLLRKTFKSLEDTWGRERSARDGSLIKAMALVLDKVGDQMDLASLADKLARDGTPAKLLGTARTHKMATGKALYVQAAEVMVNIYNKQRTSRRVYIA